MADHPESGEVIRSGEFAALTSRAVRMYERYGDELESLRQLLHMRLSMLAAAYTLSKQLPPRSVRIESRVKTLGSFLRKLERHGWPSFYYPEEVITDLIAGRLVCWFLDDCYGILAGLEEAPQFIVAAQDVEDYVRNPKPSGYRSIHLLARMSCDRVHLTNGQAEVGPASALVEIQIRTELQHVWSEITQEIHNGGQTLEDEESGVITALSRQLANEDSTAEPLRKIVQRLWADSRRRRLTRSLS